MGLLYAQAYPDRVSKLVLVGPGPLNAEMGEYYRGNRERMAYPVTPDEFSRLGDRYKKAKKEGSDPRDADEVRMRAWAPVMFFSREHAARLVDEYLACGGYQRSLAPATTSIRRCSCSMPRRSWRQHLSCMGIRTMSRSLAYLIRERIPQTRIRFLNRCGHMTWIEQPEGTFEAVDSFLSEGSAGW